MNNIFKNITEDFILTGDIKQDVYSFLIKNKRFIIAEHSLHVAKRAKLIAKQYSLDEESAEISGLLHDIGGVYSNEERIEICKALGIDILPEEEKLPLILHQKISKIMAKEIFNIDSEEILTAISCHTTLRANSSTMDKVLFIADKIEWDQAGEPPYTNEIKAALDISLEKAAFSYIEYLLGNKERLKVVHPWLEEAYLDLRKNVVD
jgi:predicted HD superfamily hydrolase involved in NAD metabolism